MPKHAVGADGLTDNQRKLYYFIADYHKENGFPPTFREMMKHMEFTINGVVQMLNVMEYKGFVILKKNVARSTLIVERDRREHNVDELDQLRKENVMLRETVARLHKLLRNGHT